MSYLGWKFVHVAGAFAFVASHGTSAAVLFRLRAEREPPRIQALLDLSRSTRGLMYSSLVVLVGSGIVTGSRLQMWGSGWIWTSIGLLVFLFLAAVALALPYYRRVRRLLEDGSDDVVSMLRSPLPIVIAIVETAGILAILWLMVFKPF